MSPVSTLRLCAIVVASFLMGGAVRAEQAETRVVTVGPEYAMSDRKQFWFGSGYRDLWTTPITLPVLDLRTEAGGLKPVRQVGQNQSLGLAMAGANGRSYTFRSLHKEADRMLPEPLRGTMAGAVVRDLTSGTHPAAGVILPLLAEAAGVPHTTPRLVIMPNDPSLGEFARNFANQIGTLEEFPLPAGGTNPGFMGATQIISSTEMWRRWMQGPENRFDSVAYLRARVLDLWLDNYDRHRGQWRWMRLPGHESWQPLPEDPDFVLIHRDGLVARQIRGQVPQYLAFSSHFPGRIDGALLNSAEMDRWILSGLAAADFEQMARELQGRFTDEVIDKALRQMPPEWYAISGASTTAALRARRTDLVNYLLRVYRYYADNVDVHATDQAEHVSIERAADGSVDVTVAVIGPSAAPYFRRRFLKSETDEVRIFLHGGDDHVVRTGPGGGPITVRVIAGGGRDAIDDSKGGGTDVWRDAGTIEVTRGPGTHVRNDPWPNPAPVKDAPWIEPRSYGAWTIPTPLIGYMPDVQLYLGYGFTRTTWGFRTEPARSVQTLKGAVSTGVKAGRLEYLGTFRRPASGVAFRLQAFGSGVDHFNYFGAGNESADVDDRARYQTREGVLSVTPALHYEVGRRWDAFAGAELRYSRTPTDATTILSEEAPVGVGPFSRLAVRAGMAFDSRQAAKVAARADYTDVSFAGDPFHANGIRFEASGFVAPQALDVQSQYQGVEGLLAAYAGTDRAHLAFRVGGRAVSNDYAWFDAAHVGGHNNRGYRSHRFTGNSSLYASGSVRAWLGSFNAGVAALRLGVTGFSDVGRVWLDGEQSEVWHPSFGGGLLFQPLGTPLTLNVIAAWSKEGTRAYFGMGYPF